MNLREVSNTLGLHYNTVLKYVSLDLIHAVKIGKSYRVTEEEIERIKREGVTLNSNK